MIKIFEMEVKFNGLTLFPNKTDSNNAFKIGINFDFQYKIVNCPTQFNVIW
jgi:hypothetical protein